MEQKHINFIVSTMKHIENKSCTALEKKKIQLQVISNASTLHDEIKSKKISNDQELIQSDPTSCPQTKREITKYIN